MSYPDYDCQTCGAYLGAMSGFWLRVFRWLHRCEPKKACRFCGHIDYPGQRCWHSDLVEDCPRYQRLR